MTARGQCPTGRNRPTPAPTAFATTHWSLVARAGHTGLADGQAALEELCRIYWHPLYCFACRHCPNPQDAADLTQGFFADLLARDGMARADAARGRFRTFLLCSFQYFCSHVRARASARKRGGDCAFVSIEAMEETRTRLSGEITTTDSPERLFDRRWAMHIIDRALVAVRAEYAAVGKAPLFDELQAVLKSEDEGQGYPAMAARLNLQVGNIKVAAFRLRRRLALEIRAEVAKTVANPDDVDDEMRHLLAAIVR